MSDWPDPNKPGMPLNPERDGIHWLFNPDNDKPHPVIWVADLGTWAVGDVWTPRMVAEMGLHYQGPVLMPAETDALRAENARLREALNTLLETADKCKIMEIGAGGMSIEAQAARSVYLRVPVWPFEDARAALAGEVKP